MKFAFAAFFLLISRIAAECPNSCSGHGVCGAHDMCSCYRNWMASDCSQRVCQYGNSFVDSPKGDLDASNEITGTTPTVVVNSDRWKYGTQEMYPLMQTAGGTALSNNAHEYFECSNKGSCNRETGDCECYTGYEGAACQRASCPVNSDGETCSGHGVCKSAKDLAYSYYNNTYDLWDKDMTMGCQCDGGFYGPDCSQRKCKVGVDPLFTNDGRYPSFANWTFMFSTTNANSALVGNYTIILEDIYGETWETAPIDIDATCATIISRFEELPNNAFNNVLCRLRGDTSKDGSTVGHSTDRVDEPISDAGRYDYTKFTLVFPTRPGYMLSPRVNKFTDGYRPTLASSRVAGNDMMIRVYKNGYQGEDVDLAPTRCEGMYVTLLGANDHTQLIPGTNDDASKSAFKKCLSDGDGDWTNNIGVENWDRGTPKHPHLVKLGNLHQFSNNGYSTDADETYYKQIAYELDDTSTPISYICDKLKSDPTRFAEINTRGNNENVAAEVCAAINPPRVYALVIYDETDTKFKTFNRLALDYNTAARFSVYTSANTIQLVTYETTAVTEEPAPWSATEKILSQFNPYFHTSASTVRETDMSCEGRPADKTADGYDNMCLNVNDEIFVAEMPTYSYTNCDATGVAKANTDSASCIDTALTQAKFECNPIYFNKYKVTKLAVEPLSNEAYAGNMDALTFPYTESADLAGQRTIVSLDGGMNAKYLDDTCQAFVYKVLYNYTEYPSTAGYDYVSECSGRGTCDTETGLCECFPGYTSDNCDTQSALVQ